MVIISCFKLKMQLDVDVSPPANIIKINYQYHMLANLYMGTLAMVHNPHSFNLLKAVS